MLVAALAAVAALVLGVLAADRYAAERSPASVVRGYFQALAAGDAPLALAFADTPPRGPLLTSTVLGQQLQAAALDDLAVLNTVRLGATATVAVRYRLRFANGDRTVTDQADLVRRGSSWRLSRVAAPVRILTDAQLVTFAGGPAPSGAALLFPGALPLAPAAGLQVDNQPALRLADTHLVSFAHYSITPRAQQQAMLAVNQLLAGCLAPAAADPLCPLPGDCRSVPGSLHGTAAESIAGSAPRIMLAPTTAAPPTIRVRARVPVRGSWECWDFENQVIRRHGQVTIEVRAELALDRPSTAFWDRSP